MFETEEKHGETDLLNEEEGEELMHREKMSTCRTFEAKSRNI